jgi:hypothetical protein
MSCKPQLVFMCDRGRRDCWREHSGPSAFSFSNLQVNYEV